MDDCTCTVFVPSGGLTLLSVSLIQKGSLLTGIDSNVTSHLRYQTDGGDLRVCRTKGGFSGVGYNKTGTSVKGEVLRISR